MRQTSILLVLLAPLFLIGCSDKPLKDAAKAKAVIEASKTLPDLLTDCRNHAQAGVRVGDRLDVAVLKTSGALKRQNARTDRCAAWYDDLRAGFVGPH